MLILFINDLDRVRYRNWTSSINLNSGAWLSAGLSPKLFQMSNNEFVSALCRRNTFEDPMVPKQAPITSREDSTLFSCECDGGARPKAIDPFGYHLVGCRIGANAIRHKLNAFKGKAKVSRIKAVMKWWTKCISMVIAKTASRNVAFKSDKLMDALFQEGQSAPQTPQTFFDADFEDLGQQRRVVYL